jgi:hypothetical protein
MTFYERGLQMSQAIRRGIRWLSYCPAVEVTGDLFMEATPLEPSADEKARRLLLRVLKPAQREQYRSHGFFTVHLDFGSFCILPRTRFNVVNMGTGTAYCAGPEITVPLADMMLAQKLMLEHEPERFFRVANYMKDEGRSFGRGY